MQEHEYNCFAETICELKKSALLLDEEDFVPIIQEGLGQNDPLAIHLAYLFATLHQVVSSINKQLVPPDRPF